MVERGSGRLVKETDSGMVADRDPQAPVTDVTESGEPRARSRTRKLEKTRRDLDALAHFLDETFAVPGTRWRFGVEALIGLVPVVGDLVSAGLGSLLIFRAVQFRLPGIVVARMAFNTLLDLTLGAIPFIGDAFDFVYRSNRRNIELFRRYADDPHRSTLREWLFFGLVVLVVVGLIWLLITGVGWLLRQIGLT